MPASHGKTFVDSTSGSTGRPLRALKTELTTVLFNAITLRNHLWHARDLHAKLAIIRRDHRGRSWHPDGSTQPHWGFPTGRIFETGQSLKLDIRCPIAEQIDWLRRQQPAYLNTIPSNLDLLARHAREHGAAIPDKNGPRNRNCVHAPPWYPHLPLRSEDPCRRRGPGPGPGSSRC